MSSPPASASLPAYAAELAVAVEAARAASAIQVEHYERLEHIVKKSARDVVTEADHLSEATIIATIRTAFPDDQILAEELGHSEAPAGRGPVDGSGAMAPVDDEHRIWVIDPLDGTVNYASGSPTSVPAWASWSVACPPSAWCSIPCAATCSRRCVARAPGWVSSASMFRRVS